MAQEGTLVAPTGGAVLNYKKVNLAATDDTCTLNRFLTWAYVAIQLAGTWTGTVTFEVTVDGSTWVTVSATPSNSATTVTSATGNGVWTVQMAGYEAIRCRFSTASSGTVNTTMKALQSQF